MHLGQLQWSCYEERECEKYEPDGQWSCYEERECEKYEPDGWLCDRCQYIALVDTGSILVSYQ